VQRGSTLQRRWACSKRPNQGVARLKRKTETHIHKTAAALRPGRGCGSFGASGKDAQRDNGWELPCTIFRCDFSCLKMVWFST
jgi:hypothetical protein